MEEEKSKFINSVAIPLSFIVVLWIVEIISSAWVIDFGGYGIYPRTFKGLQGILLSPLIHSGFPHLISNTIPLLILGFSIVYFYPDSSLKVILIVYFVTGVLVWLFAREAFHIGASGLVYGFAGFLFFSGIFKRDNRSIALALIVTFLYGGMIWGVLPGVKDISWESHLAGGMTGIVAAFIFRKSDVVKKYDWEDEDDDDDDNGPLEISYDADKNNF